MTADPLSRLFHSRLATATRNEMLAILNCKGFLKEYELGFNPDPVTFGIDNNPDPNMTASKKIDRKKDVRDLIPRLQDRLRARAATALNPLVPTPLPAFPSLLNTTVQRLADAQLSLFRKWFPDGRGGIRFLSFQRCFEQFANGELRDPSVIGHPGFGEPDSDAYFFFAEFAFLCIELGFNKSLWRQALRTFVKTQEIFMHVYRETPALRPPRVNARLPDPGPARPTRFFDFSNFQAIGPSVTMGKGQSDRNRKVVLRAKYDGMSESALKAAMRDNLLRALRMP